MHIGALLIFVTFCALVQSSQAVITSLLLRAAKIESQGDLSYPMYFPRRLPDFSKSERLAAVDYERISGSGRRIWMKRISFNGSESPSTYGMDRIGQSYIMLTKWPEPNLLTKYDPSGTQVWEAEFKLGYLYELVFGPNNELYVVRLSFGSPKESWPELLSISSSGKLNWRKQLSFPKGTNRDNLSFVRKTTDGFEVGYYEDILGNADIFLFDFQGKNLGRVKTTQSVFLLRDYQLEHKDQYGNRLRTINYQHVPYNPIRGYVYLGDDNGPKTPSKRGY